MLPFLVHHYYISVFHVHLYISVFLLPLKRAIDVHIKRAISLSLSLSLSIYIYIYIYIYVFLPSKRAVKELREPDTKTAICYVQHDLIEITCKSSKLGRSGQPSFAHNCTVPDGSWAAHTHTHSHTHTHTHTHR